MRAILRSSVAGPAALVTGTSSLLEVECASVSVCNRSVAMYLAYRLAVCLYSGAATHDSPLPYGAFSKLRVHVWDPVILTY